METEPAKEAQTLFSIIARLAHCRPSVRGKKDRKRTLREIVRTCEVMIDDKRVKR